MDTATDRCAFGRHADFMQWIAIHVIVGIRAHHVNNISAWDPCVVCVIIEIEAQKLLVKDEDERNKDESIAHLKFLWGSYESRYYWWEVVEMARKLVLTGLLVIFLEGSVPMSCTGLQ